MRLNDFIQTERSIQLHLKGTDVGRCQLHVVFPVFKPKYKNIMSYFSCSYLKDGPQCWSYPALDGHDTKGPISLA